MYQLCVCVKWSFFFFFSSHCSYGSTYTHSTIAKLKCVDLFPFFFSYQTVETWTLRRVALLNSGKEHTNLIPIRKKTSSEKSAFLYTLGYSLAKARLKINTNINTVPSKHAAAECSRQMSQCIGLLSSFSLLLIWFGGRRV